MFGISAPFIPQFQHSRFSQSDALPLNLWKLDSEVDHVLALHMKSVLRTAGIRNVGLNFDSS